MTHKGASTDSAIPKSNGGVNGDKRVDAPSEILAYRRSAAPWPLENAMKWIRGHVFTSRKISVEGADFNVDRRQREALLNAGALLGLLLYQRRKRS